MGNAYQTRITQIRIHISQKKKGLSALFPANLYEMEFEWIQIIRQSSCSSPQPHSSQILLFPHHPKKVLRYAPNRSCQGLLEHQYKYPTAHIHHPKPRSMASSSSDHIQCFAPIRSQQPRVHTMHWYPTCP